MSEPPAFAFQFTGPAPKRDRPCARHTSSRNPCLSIIPGNGIAGTHYHIVGDRQSGENMEVCPSCYTYILGQQTTGRTVLRTAAPAPQQRLEALPVQGDRENHKRQIQTDIVHARRQGVHHAVTALPGQAQGAPASHGPRLPTVLVPTSAWGQGLMGPPTMALSALGGVPAPPGVAHPSSNGAGYSSTHPEYPSELNRWARKAYASIPEPPRKGAGMKIPLELSIGRPSPKTGKVAMIVETKEGTEGTADITVLELRNLLRTLVHPRLQRLYPYFPFDFEQGFVLRDTTANGFTNLDFKGPAYTPFWSLVFKPKENPTKTQKANEPVFHKPKAAFQVSLVMEPHEIKRLDKHLEEQDSDFFKALNEMAENGLRPVDPSLSVRERNTGRRAPTIAPLGKPFVPVNVVSDPKAKDKRKAQAEIASGSDSDDKYTTESLKISSETLPETTSGGTSKRSRTTSMIPTTPPQAKKREPPVFVSPEAMSLKQAMLQAGGLDTDINHLKPMFNTITKHVTVWGIQKWSLEEILMNKISFQMSNEDPRRVHATMELRLQAQGINYGAQKRCIPGRLTDFSIDLPTILWWLQSGGKSKNVAIKQFLLYHEGYGPDTHPKRDIRAFQLSPVQECKAIEMEATLLLWADSLLGLSEGFVKKVVKEKGPPPFDLPLVRFVEGAVAMTRFERATTSTSKDRMNCYLVEEALDGDYWVKYISNNQAVPLVPESHAEYEMAEYLCFHQHVQYMKTKKLMYFSDLQGVGGVLSDPQIMTDSSVKLFGDGNIGEAFDQFPVEHKCNKYCKWSEIEGPEDGQVRTQIETH